MKSTFGNVQKHINLKYFIANCHDIEEEKTLLQSMVRSMGVMVNWTPKCHCKLDRVGIAYSRGCSKNQCQWMPIMGERGIHKSC